MMNRLLGFSLTLISIFLIFSILIAGQSFFVPFLIALVIAYFIIGIAEAFTKIQIGRLKVPCWLSYIFAFGVLAGALYLFGTIVTNNITVLIQSAPVYQEKLEGIVEFFFEKIGRPMPDLTEKIKEFNFASILSQIAFVVTDIAGNTGMIAVYILFILIESHYFDQKLMATIPSQSGKDSARKILNKIGKQTRSYIRIKTLISLLTGVLSYGILRFIGVDFAEFWALLIFLLNYIPTIGSIVATIFPIMLSLVQFGEVWPVMIVTVGLVGTQFLVGNIIEPRVMGTQFNLSGLVIIISLVLWGQIWGVIGMLLCVPLIMIASIILANFDQTRWVAILLSQSGELKE